MLTWDDFRVAQLRGRTEEEVRGLLVEKAAAGSWENLISKPADERLKVLLAVIDHGIAAPTPEIAAAFVRFVASELNVERELDLYCAEQAQKFLASHVCRGCDDCAAARAAVARAAGGRN